MKTNKIFLSVVMLLLIMGAVSGRGFAQSHDKRDPPPMGRIGEPNDSKTPEERATMRADKMKLDLLLTDDQYKSVYNVLLADITASMKLRNENTTLDKESMRAGMKKIHESTDEQLKGILSTEQYELYKKHMKDMMKKPGDHDNHKGLKDSPKDHD